MKFLRWVGALILLVLVLLIGSIAYVAQTETGTQWLLTQVGRMVPGELQTTQVEGRLGEALTLTGLRYRTPDFTLDIEYLHFAWRPAALLEATFWVEQLHLREVSWRQERPSAPSASEAPMTLPEIQLPLKVKAESVRLQKLSLHPLGASPVVIDTMVLRGNFDSQLLEVAELGISAPHGQLAVSGKIAFQGAYPLDFAMGWKVPTPELGEVVGRGKVEGDLRQLTLRQEVQTPFSLQFRGRLFELLEQPHWVAVVEIPETELEELSSQWPPLRLGLNLKGAGGLNQFKVRGSYQIQEARLGKLSGKLSGEQRAMGHWVLNQLSLQQIEGPAHLSFRGEVMMAEGQPQLSLEGQWQDLAWPLTGTAQFSSDWGQLALVGSPAAYQLQVSSALAGQNIPTSEWHLAGRGDTTQFGLKKLQGQLLQGSVRGSGSFHWSPALTWQLQLEGKSLNPAEQWPAWPGELAFSTDTRGTLEDSARALMIDLQTLSGSLRGYPVAAQGQVQLQETTWRIADLRVRSGDSQFSMAGTINERVALDWRFASPDLSQLLPTAQGDLKAKGHLRGPLQQPALTLRLQGEKLAYQDLQLASVAADVNVDLQGKRSSQLWVEATDFTLGTQALRSLALQGRGTPAQHELRLEVVAPERSLALEAQGSWKEMAWQGQLSKALYTDSQTGHWETAAPASLTLSPSQVDLAPWCWQQQRAQLCLGGHWQQGGVWQARLRMADFSLAVLAPLLPEKTTLEGTIAGEARVQGEAHQLAQAQLQLNASAGQLAQVTPEGQILRFAHEGGQVKLRLEEEGGAGSFQLLLAEPSAALVQASLRLPPAPWDLTALGQLPLAGQISAAFDDLAFVALLLPELEAVQGQLRVDLDLGGRVAAPQLRGQVVLQEGSAQVVPLGLALTGIRLRVEASGQDRVTFAGEVHSGEGQLAFNGQVRLDPAAGWPARVTVAGERFEAMRTAEIRVLISPQLEIRVAAEGIRVEGEVAVPEATLEITDIKRRGGVPVSKDVVMVSQEKEAEAKALPIYARVRITLGDNVSVQAFGFKGQVAGNLLVTETPGKVTTGNGELRVVEGQYKAYGQQLDIQQGRVIFAGPINNPRLNVKAVRQIGDVIAGVRIQGLANAPVLTLFSEPTMNEDNILAYLLLGRPLATASGDEGSLLAKAATSLGLSGGNLLAKRIGETFGLEEVGIEAKGETQSQALVLGKHLSPRLYIGYGIGIFERFSAFQMRYTLSEHWSLQAETGLESGVDLFYNLER
ncbi:translocation/assembly module TamB domain-containing protein [Nitrosococcus wardiae]|uniref:Translocation/assembly module TamB n=1 Tax=Nitrosococcus wardiae TaxID=1814290 RepID=A0A4P7C011_9GAMM|nr:translocation/assembly module TamB domain-containing protein [Nitrosococcus wardiae]QBQ54036.1 translocation/assembly module TamB [Nitrosococcus wardiae]